MARRHWILSGLLLYHVGALTVDAIPEPGELRPTAVAEREGQRDALSARLTPVFDWLALSVGRVEPFLFAASQPLRFLTKPYVNAGLRQTWNMFTDPELSDHYLRLDYLVVSGGSNQPRRIQELILPVGREDRVRVLHDFRDKAVVNLLIAFFEAESAEKPTKMIETRDRFVPLVRYFERRFQRRQLSPGDRIVRTEVWYGSAAIPPPGKSVPEETLRARLDALKTYYAGPKESAVSGSFPRPLETTEREADIQWVLKSVSAS